MIYSIMKVNSDMMYVAFPKTGEIYLEPVPEEVRDWAVEATEDPHFGYVNGQKCGMYLSPADLVVFKLKFG